MNINPKVTVLMPCYNAELYLVEAVDSILNQTYTNLEILLIDDGSKDRTQEIILDYASKDSRVVAVINERNLGLIRSLNKGILMASGEFIARMDADDITTLNRIERIVAEFILHPEYDIISASYYRISASGKMLGRNYPKATISKALQFVSFFITPIVHACMLARTKVLCENLFDENYLYSEDYELFSRLLATNYKILNLTEPLYYIRLNSQSVSFEFEKIQIATHTQISVRNIDHYFNEKFDYILHKVMINRISFNVSHKIINNAIQSLYDLKDKFIERENPSSEVIVEIDDFLKEQVIDIYFQSFKMAYWHKKPFMLLLIVAKLHIFTSKRGWQYFRTKLTFLPTKKEEV